MYFAYITPIFEYASVVWDSAPRHEYYFATMEKLQIAAARIVTGTNTLCLKTVIISRYRVGTVIDPQAEPAFILTL